MGKRYGAIGWKEFLTARAELLNAMDISKMRNASRPVQVEHGRAAEAAVREWLGGYLPKRYAVTSGFVVPDVIASNYKLYEFDVIIYDQIEAPILWIDRDPDHSKEGAKLAIPAQHAKGVIEVKSSFNHKQVMSAIQKIAQLSELQSFLPPKFFSGIIFFDLDPSLVSKKQILLDLIPDRLIPGYIGGMVLRCRLNPEMTGEIVLMPAPEKLEDRKDIDIALAKDLDTIGVQKNDKGQVTISEQGAGVEAYSDGKEWHYTMLYGPTFHRRNTTIQLQWSFNGFASFAIGLLLRISGRYEVGRRQVNFGQAFDEIV